MKFWAVIAPNPFQSVNEMKIEATVGPQMRIRSSATGTPTITISCHLSTPVRTL